MMSKYGEKMGGIVLLEMKIEKGEHNGKSKKS